MATSGFSNQAVTTFAYTQTNAASTWNIAHNLNSYPVVDVYVSNNGTVQKVIPMSVTYVDGNTVSIGFSQPHSGFATVS